MRRLLATLFCAALLLGATFAKAESPADSYPSGPISLVVCYTTKSISASPSSSSTSPARAA